MIPFTRPYLGGAEASELERALESGNWVGGGPFTRRCEEWLATHCEVSRALLTTSCTHALEMAALLLEIGPGDEVIMPSYTFVSTANAFALRGAKLIFSDSTVSNPNLDPEHVAALVTPSTRCIVPVHYAGIACDMDALQSIASRHDLVLVEDAAQAVDSFHRDRPLGSIGRFGALSFHATKNISAGEGGALLIQAHSDVQQAEIIREKGTNRSAFFRGEVDKYGWVGLGSSYVPSDLLAALLNSQLASIREIQTLRLAVWHRYHEAFACLETDGWVKRPVIPEYATNNAHMYYLVCANGQAREELLEHLRAHAIQATFHYSPLHNSQFYQRTCVQPEQLPQVDRYDQCLVRLPLFAGLSDAQVERVIEAVIKFFPRSQ